MLEQNQKKGYKRIFLQNLVAGLAWGIGSVIGATVIVGLLGGALLRSQNIPIIGTYIAELAHAVNSANTQK